MLNNKSQNSGAAYDAEIKKRQDEAKKITEMRLAAQRQQERSRFQLQIDNRKRELDRLNLEVKNKEARLNELKLKLDQAKRQQFVLKGQLKQEEGGVDYLKDQVQAEESRVTTSSAELNQAKINLATAEREIPALETQAHILQAELAEVQAKIEHQKVLVTKLDQDYRSLEANSKHTVNTKTRTVQATQNKKKELQKETQEITFRGRQIEELERDEKVISQEISRLARDRDSKQKELRDLEIKRDQIKS
ncbi:MAG: hypothetical protein WC027_00750 [Candidatus Paceibacterota bacterium]